MKDLDYFYEKNPHEKCGPFRFDPGPQKWLNRVDLKNFDLSDLEDTEKSTVKPKFTN